MRCGISRILVHGSISWKNVKKIKACWHRFVRVAYGVKIYFKREDLNHSGVHKINNVIGQLLLAGHLQVAIPPFLF